MADLITNQRAKLNLPHATTSDDNVINARIRACSAAIQSWCRRDFVATAYDELYHGHGADYLQLRQYPLLSVEAVRYSPRAVLRIQNTATSTNQQARVAVTATGLELVRVASGTKTIDTSISWTSYATLTAVATAVDALGSGWDAQVVGDYGLWPSADLRLPQGALDCRGRLVDLAMHADELATYEVDERLGLLYLSPATAPENLGWPPSWQPGPWVQRANYWRVQYTAGYATVPEEVQEACAQWVAALFFAGMRDPGLAWQKVEGAGSHGVPEVTSQHVPPWLQCLLARYRRFDVMTL